MFLKFVNDNAIYVKIGTIQTISKFEKCQNAISLPLISYRRHVEERPFIYRKF